AGDVGPAKRPGMPEIETQPVGRDDRALLRHMLAEPPAQRLMQQVGNRMIGAQTTAPAAIDPQLDRFAHPQRAVFDAADVDEQVAGLAGRILDRELAAGGREDRPGIADLAARLAVEGRLVDDDADLVAGSGFIHPLLAAQNGQDDALRGLGLIAEEFAGPDLFAQGEPGRLGRRLAGADPAAARLLALARYRRLEALDRHLAALAPQHVLRHVERKAEGVVEA